MTRFRAVPCARLDGPTLQTARPTSMNAPTEQPFAVQIHPVRTCKEHICVRAMLDTKKIQAEFASVKYCFVYFYLFFFSFLAFFSLFSVFVEYSRKLQTGSILTNIIVNIMHCRNCWDSQYKLYGGRSIGYTKAHIIMHCKNIFIMQD